MNPLNHRNLLLSPDAATEGAPTDTTPAVDFSAMENTSSFVIAPANGTHLCKIIGFEPILDKDTGTVQQFRFTLEAAEAIPDNQKPSATIGEGSRLGTYGMFVSSSQYRDAIKEVKIISQALNDIVRDPRNDPGLKKADAAWAALSPQAKRPAYIGTPPMLDTELEWYSQHIGTLVLATLSTKAGKDGIERTNLVGLLAKSTHRSTKGQR